MKNVTCLVTALAILAFLLLGCSQEGPTSTSGNDLVPQKDAPTVSGQDEAVPQLTPELAGNPIRSCCPKGFTLVAVASGGPADLNGDGGVCRKVTAAGTIIIDNNAPGNCEPLCPEGTIPPDCLPDPDF